MAVDGRIEAGSLFLGNPPVQKDFRRNAGDELDRVMVQQLERLLSPYRARRPRALDYGSPEGLRWAAIPNLSAGQLGGARIALADWAGRIKSRRSGTTARSDGRRPRRWRTSSLGWLPPRLRAVEASLPG